MYLFKSILSIGLILLFLNVTAQAQQLSAFKNQEFSHGKVIKKGYGSDFQVIDYNEQRDVNGQDEIPVKQAKADRVELLPQGYEKSQRIAGVNTWIAGHSKKFQFAVIFIHGAGGNRDLGFEDWTFGGNFNRLKNLIIRTNGLYVSASAKLNKNGATAIGKMIQELKTKNPSAPVILSCASAGGSICKDLSLDSKYASLVDGIIFLGSAVNLDIDFTSEFFKNKKPVLFAHGSSDPVMPWQYMYQNFELLKSKKSPTRFYLYQTGIHGTPIRMFDWREGLNWIFKNI